MTVIPENNDLVRYLKLKNSILFIMRSDEYEKEILGKAINIFHQEIIDLEIALEKKGYIFDHGVCATGLDLPMLYIKDENGEFEEKGFKVTEIEAIWSDDLIRRNLPSLIAEINRTPLKPMLDG